MQLHLGLACIAETGGGTQVKRLAFWVVTPCSFEGTRHFGGTFCLQKQASCLLPVSAGILLVSHFQSSIRRLCVSSKRRPSSEQHDVKIPNVFPELLELVCSTNPTAVSV
jgi:hypothetical protein